MTGRATGTVLLVLTAFAGCSVTSVEPDRSASFVHENGTWLVPTVIQSPAQPPSTDPNWPYPTAKPPLVATTSLQLSWLN